MLKKSINLLLSFVLLNSAIAQAQSHPAFPQAAINSALQNAFKNQNPPQAQLLQKSTSSTNSFEGVFKAWNGFDKVENSIKHRTSLLNKSTSQVIDTVVVGEVPNDTLVISGTWTHNGPIYVFNDGVLIIKNATVTNVGEVYVFGHGKLVADSSSLTFPQQYFYERSLLVVQNGYASIKNSSFDYSGYSHNLFLADSAVVEFTNIHQRDFTTCGMFGSPSLSINGCNLTGEYILTGTANVVFKHVDTLLLWHQFADSALINFSFPNGDTVNSYVFNKNLPGVSGVGYSVQVDTAHTVWWALMPVNGSDVTVSNSTIRAIGAWFTKGDTATVSGLYNNSSYTNYVMPVTDRNLHLINSSVQTWSLYVFDTSHVTINSCQLGEVGCQQRSSVFSSQFLLDGSGGYFWTTDTSFTLADNVTIYSTVRSEKNGIFVLGYSWLPFAAPAAINNSLMVCVQNKLAQEPIPYDNGVAWMVTIDVPDSAYNVFDLPVLGSAWIDGGPQGGWMNLDSYSLAYQLFGDTVWTSIIDTTSEVHNGYLGTWKSQFNPPGNYIFRLLTRNNLGDSIEAFKAIKMIPYPVGIRETNEMGSTVKVFPNPSEGIFQFELNTDEKCETKIEIENVLGEKIFEKKIEIVNGKSRIPVAANLKTGVYFYRILLSNTILTGKLSVN